MKTVKSLSVGTAALAAIAASAHAQIVYETNTTRMIYEVSLDGANWSSSVASTPGIPVAFRVRFVYTGTTPVSKLIEARYQPVITGWSAATDTLAPFHNNGGGTNSTTPVGYLPASNAFPTTVHKVQPFAAFSQVALGAGNLRSFITSNSLRIAGSNATAEPGTGAANNNVTGNFGVASTQLAQNANPATSLLGSDVVVFKGSFTPGGSDVRDLTISSPMSSIALLAPSGVPAIRAIFWLREGSTYPAGDVRSSPVIEDATVHILPTPGAAALVGLSTLAAARRRRAS